MEDRAITLRIGGATITLGLSWLLVAPVSVWLLAIFYLPIMAPFLSGAETWVAALVFALLAGLALVGHVVAHTGIAALIGSELPERIPLYAFGEAAHVWPPARDAAREALAASAGPLASLLLAGLAYFIWNRQWNPYLSAAMLFLVLFNLALALVNLSPGFPTDGGRLTRAIIQGLLRRPALAGRVGRWLGYLVILIVTAWGIGLLVQRARFHLETGAATLVVAMLLFIALWRHPDPRLACGDPRRVPGGGASLLRGLLAGLLMLGLLAVPLGLLPTLHGLRTPGFAVAVGPMVSVPPENRYPYTGQFFLTAVVEQTPILLAQWVYGRLSPTADLVSPEQVVPPGITPQELMAHNFRLLVESETIAAAVALRLAGYPVQATGEGVEVISVLPESPARGRLVAGDRIIELNNEPIETVAALTERLATLDPSVPVTLVVERDGRQLEMTTRLMEPRAPDEPARLGITARTVGFDVELPFPVWIEPRKIVGGPSAGLMFTLAIYNLVTPDDLAGGHKIAGTGTISLEGEVGSIGGVAQKVAAAEQAGLEYFLVPAANSEWARRVARDIEVVGVATGQEAIDFLRSLPSASDPPRE